MDDAFHHADFDGTLQFAVDISDTSLNVSVFDQPEVKVTDPKNRTVNGLCVLLLVIGLVAYFFVDFDETSHGCLLQIKW